ncbi:MAG: type 1 glutamine amidotransferase [Thermodesulfatator sp.]|nr:MAG: type 1 glutamine amidotransferase [Thermodesulfatator sp.]
MKVLVITADGFEDSELLCPVYRFKEEGFEVDIAAPEWGQVRGKKGYNVSANLSFDELEPSIFDALYIPGGKAPAHLKHMPVVQEIVQAFDKAGKPIAAICHGPLILAAAGVLAGRKVTCYLKVAEDLQSAGARYENSPVVVDGNLVTSREPADIPYFMKEVIRIFRQSQRR